MTCKRCGWDGHGPVRPTIKDADVAVLPPLPVIRDPHLWNSCPCPFTIGEEIYYEADLDSPPARGVFCRLVEFAGPEFLLQDGFWIKVTQAVPSVGEIETAVGVLRVPFNKCCAIARWPTVEI